MIITTHGSVAGAALVLVQEQMAGVRGRNVVTVMGRYWIPFRKHFPGYKEFSWLQPEAACHVGCG